MRCKMKSQGFTLIELLVAISILAIVAVLGWRGLDSIVRSREVLTAELEQTRGLQLTFAQLQSDCAQNVNPFNYPNLPEGRSSWIEPQRLILIRNVFSDDQAPAMQVVTYRLQNSTITRFESISTRDLTVLTQLLAQARNPPDQQVEIVMQKKVQSVEFTGYPDSSVAANSTTSTAGNTNSTNSPGNPAPGNQPVNNGVQNVNQANATTGLQVSLQLQNNDKNMLKIFILGGA
ncbi:PulJ/GspJ family protein [Solimicrobium silvestre]|uniref:Prepilin-type N-terminal cleavage/methylation domain n=1 Tax=Solimicrobium silvestre TaxID=2099400 RepID=A0A2S9GYS6_9BURK|nr:prepilin-type N-terminal cleavage/methylation domain-containing protein [Solimicrobium silvestre]PRC92861.1 Prepilin-type N-terminal cleavage/methylation domain [Solimicrobium silvestre]